MSVGQKSTKEKFMKKTFIFMSIVLLTFSFIFIGCGDDKADPALNGTWVDGDEKIKFDNGDFSIYGDNVEFVRGTYETDDGKLTMTVTEVNVEDEWCTKTQYEAKKPTLGVLADYYGGLFETETVKYSIDGNKLTLTDENGSKTIFTKQ
jgi:hypothetical protein